MEVLTFISNDSFVGSRRGVSLQTQSLQTQFLCAVPLKRDHHLSERHTPHPDPLPGGEGESPRCSNFPYRLILYICAVYYTQIPPPANHINLDYDRGLYVVVEGNCIPNILGLTDKEESMPLARTKFPTDRLNFYGTLTKQEIDWLKSHREIKVLPV